MVSVCIKYKMSNKDVSELVKKKILLYCENNVRDVFLKMKIIST